MRDTSLLLGNTQTGKDQAVSFLVKLPWTTENPWQGILVNRSFMLKSRKIYLTTGKRTVEIKSREYKAEDIAQGTCT